MPDMDGIEVLRLLAEQHCDVPILMISNYQDGILTQAVRLAIPEGLGLNLAGSLNKPIQLPRLEAAGTRGRRLGRFEVPETHPRTAQQGIERFGPDVIILDLFMPDMDGIEVLRLLAEQHCDVPILMISNYQDGILTQAVRLAEGLGLNLAGSLNKPIQLPRLEAALEAAA